MKTLFTALLLVALMSAKGQDLNIGRPSESSLKETTVNVELPDTIVPGQHLVRAGNLFISGICVQLGGIALLSAGLATDKKELTIIGAGVSGVSIFLYIGAGNQMRKEGFRMQKF